MPPAAVESVESTVAVFLSDNGWKRAGRRLRQLPRDDVVPALLEALRQTGKARSFERITSLLAELGGDDVIDALIVQARSQKRFPRLAIRALADCKHPAAVTALVELLKGGRKKQRLAAAAGLTRRKAAWAVEALCSIAADRSDPIYVEVWNALWQVGPGHEWGRIVLLDATMTVENRLNALCALPALYHSRLSLSPFNPQRFLDREAANRRSPLRERARETAEALLARTTLLRPSAGGGEQLLRPAGGAGAASDRELLRAAGSPPTATVPENRGGWLKRLIRR